MKGFTIHCVQVPVLLEAAVVFILLPTDVAGIPEVIYETGKQRETFCVSWCICSSGKFERIHSLVAPWELPSPAPVSVSVERENRQLIRYHQCTINNTAALHVTHDFLSKPPCVYRIKPV